MSKMSNDSIWGGDEGEDVKKIDERIREELIRTAEPLPESYKRRVREVLEHLPDQKKRQRRFPKVAAVIVASMLSVSAVVTAGVKLYQQRLNSMKPEEVEEFYSVAQQQQISADLYSRDLFDAEEERLTKLGERYKREGIFPKTELKCVNAEDDVKVGELCYCYDNGTFYLPDQEMNEEELLQIVDFRYKRDYSLQKMQGGSEEKVADEKEDEEGVDISSTDSGEVAAKRGRKYLEELYGWDTEGVRREVTSDGQYYYVTLTNSEWNCDAQIEINIDSMEFSSIEIHDKKREKWKSGIKNNEKQYRKYGEEVWRMGTKLVPEEQMKHLSFGYYHGKNNENVDGVVYYYLTCIDGGGYIFNYSINMGEIYRIFRVANVEGWITMARDAEEYSFELKNVVQG